MVSAGIVGRRKCTPVELSVDGQRHRVDHHYRSRNHVAREPLGDLGSDITRIGVPGDVADEPRGTGVVVAGDHHCLGHPVESGQRSLYFAEFDAVSADLDLLVRTTEVVHLPVVVPPRQITCAIHPLAGCTRDSEGAGHKPRRRQARSPPIADAHTAAGDVQLADHAWRDRTQPRVQYEQCTPGHRLSDRSLRPRHERRADRGVHRGLGRTVGVDHHATGGPAFHQLRRTRFTRHHQRGRFQPLWRDHSRCRRGLAQHGDVFGDEQIVKGVGRFGHRFGHHQQACPM